MNISELEEKEREIFKALRLLEDKIRDIGDNQVMIFDTTPTTSGSALYYGKNNKTRDALRPHLDKHEELCLARREVVDEIIWLNASQKFALNCAKCDNLALPVRGTRNRYRCDKCVRQFVGAKHGF